MTPPSSSPTFVPTVVPTNEPTKSPTPTPPTGAPTKAPTPPTGAPTKAPTLALKQWPGSNNVATVDALGTFGENLSGCDYEAGSTNYIWAVSNSPSKIFRLALDTTSGTWASTNIDGWSPAGKILLYPTGTGAPDAEDITRNDEANALYIASERDTKSSSRNSILRYIDTPSSTTLTATHEWLLNYAFPTVTSNDGIESIVWVPDSYLVQRQFYDENSQATYDPSLYPNHGNGVYCVGLEANGRVYCFVLDHSGNGASTKVASFSSGHVKVMSLAFDVDSGYMWASCDNTGPCNNENNVLTIDSSGRFKEIKNFAPPTTLPLSNNEGFCVMPDSLCVDDDSMRSLKKVFWIDDALLNGYAMRMDDIPCGAFRK